MDASKMEFKKWDSNKQRVKYCRTKETISDIFGGWLRLFTTATRNAIASKQ